MDVDPSGPALTVLLVHRGTRTGGSALGPGEGGLRGTLPAGLRRLVVR